MMKTEVKYRESSDRVTNLTSQLLQKILTC